jgi:hypothetical protein
MTDSTLLPRDPGPERTRSLLGLALALSLGAAVSLGITRFAYGLLLPAMRADLDWSYTLAGAMNTVNALGYLGGALLMPRLLRRVKPAALLVWGALAASVFMGLSGFFVEAAPLLAQRLLAGFASALVFVSGGLLAARLAALEPSRAGLLIGLYYSGTGWGIWCRPCWCLRRCKPRKACRTAGPGPGGHWRACACWPASCWAARPDCYSNRSIKRLLDAGIIRFQA